MADTPEIRIKLDDSAGSAKYAADNYDVEAANLVEAVDKLSANLAAVSQQVSGDAADISDTLRLMRQYAQDIHRRAMDENASGADAWIPFDIRQRFLAGAAQFSGTGKGEEITQLISKLVHGGEVQLGSVAANTVTGIADSSLDEYGREKAFLPKPEDYDASGMYRPNAKDDEDDAIANAQFMSDMTAGDFTTDRAGRKGQLEAQRQKEVADLMYAERQVRKANTATSLAKEKKLNDRRLLLWEINDKKEFEADQQKIDAYEREQRGAPNASRWGNIGAGVGGSLGAKIGGFRGGAIGAGLGKIGGAQLAGIAGGTGAAATAAGVLGPFAIGVAAAATAAMTVKTAFDKLAETSDTLAAKYAEYSPQVGLAVAGREMATLQREFKYGQELGDDIAASQSRLIMRDQSYGDLGKEWDKLFLKLDAASAPLFKVESFLVDILASMLADITPHIASIAESTGEFVEDITDAAMEGAIRIGLYFSGAMDVLREKWQIDAVVGAIMMMLDIAKDTQQRDPLTELPIPNLETLFGTGHGGMGGRPNPVRPPRRPPNPYGPGEPPPGVNI